MERQHLKQTLGELHQELSAAVEVDSETLELLRQLSADISSLLPQSAGSAVESPANQSPQAARQSALDSVLSLASQFEESHPRLAATLGRMADALSRIGL